MTLRLTRRHFDLDGFVPAGPWPLPAFLGLAGGIGLAELQLPPHALLLVVPAAPALFPLLLRRRRGAPPAAATRRAERLRALFALLLPLLLVPVGYQRLESWRSLPDPLAGLRERELNLSGSSDGRILTLDEPAGVRVAASPAGSLPAGRVELRGVLQEAAGRRNPGGFDYRDYLLRRGVHGQVLVSEVLAHEGRARLLDRLREGVQAGVNPRSAALLEAMTLGVRDELGDLRDLFAAAGLAHVLALSGLHVGVLMGAAAWLLRPLGLYRYPLLIALALGFMVLVGPSPSVVRASLMVTVVLTGLWFGSGRIEAWSALGLAGTATLLLRPAWLVDLSFLLSYGAVAGILLFALPLVARLAGDEPGWWRRPGRFMLASLITSAAAQALTFPLVASSFGTVPLLSPVVNLVGIPLSSLLVPLGFLAALCGLISLQLAALVNVAAGAVAHLLILTAQLGSRLPALPWGEVAVAGHLLYLTAVAALALAAAGRLRLRRALSVVAVAALLSAAVHARTPLPELIALDVGQGDSFLIRLPGRVEILVDGGGTPFSDFDTGAGIVLPALRALGIDELEVVIATHADLDHIEGLVAVLEEMPVQVLLYGAHSDAPAFARLLETAARRGVRVEQVSRGQRLRLPGASLEILNPPPGGYGSSNDDSVVVAVHLATGGRLLLLGDISERVEGELVPPAVRVMTAAHHGSAGSTSLRLLQLARPAEVVISVGRNSYGHPSAQVLERIAAVGARARITRDEGAVRLPLGPRP